VVRFLGGEELRTYRDDAFGQDGDGFLMLRWNREMQRYDRLLVPLHTLKSIFNVKAWPEAARPPSLTVVNGPIQAQASPPGESAMLTPLLPRLRDAVVDLPDADLASGDPKVFEAALGRDIDTLLTRVGVEATSTLRAAALRRWWMTRSVSGRSTPCSPTLRSPRSWSMVLPAPSSSARDGLIGLLARLLRPRILRARLVEDV